MVRNDRGIDRALYLILTNGQVWFITGANKGIGAAIAKEALDQGYRVVATGRKTEGMENTLGASANL
ncbi:short chain dehydrogenase [compost metagenome]